MRITLLGMDNCQISGLFGLSDGLVTARQVHEFLFDTPPPEVSWHVASVGGKPVKTSNGYDIPADLSLEQVGKTDLVWVSGLTYASGEEMIQVLQHEGPLLGWLAEKYAEGSRMASYCSGSFLLAAAGILDGKRATTSWWKVRAFRKQYPKVCLDPDQVLISQDGVYTAGATTSFLNLTLLLIEEIYGEAVAAYCAKVMLMDNNKDSQAPFVSLQTYIGHKDDIVLRAQSWMQKNLHKQFDLEEVAHHAKTSKRTLIRRFKSALEITPNTYLQNLRIERAKQLLESSALSLESITEKVGYLDISTFSQLFKRKVSASPSEYRKRFAQPISKPA